MRIGFNTAFKPTMWMKWHRQTLEEAFAHLTTRDEHLPRPLPAVHVSIARWFSEIVREGKLVPRKCMVFGEELLYLFYGGSFYRTSKSPTEDRTELPVAFLFGPSMLNSVYRFYPFDTGLIITDLVGIWRDRMSDFRNRYAVSGKNGYTVPCEIVYHIFETNERYLEGLISKHCVHLPDPIPELHEFMNANLTVSGADHRKMTIECQMKTPLSLKDHLLWVAFPRALSYVFPDLCKLIEPSVPRFYHYNSHRVFNPAEIAAQLQLKADEEIQRFIKVPGE